MNKDYKATNDIIKAIKKKKSIKYVSYDIFDTLVQRKIYNHNTIFELVMNIYEKKYGNRIEDYALNRVSAEIELWKRTSEGVFLLDNIYSELSGKYGEEVAEKLKQIELYVEENIIDLNPIIIETSEKVKSDGYEIILTSDMYLGSEFIKKNLIKLGYEDFSFIFISGECRATKAKGDLFNKVEKKLNSRNVLHIGDNCKGDFLKPRLSGMKSIMYRPYCNKYYNIRNIKNLSDEILIGLINNHPVNDMNYFYDIGYSILGPILLGFSTWIRKEMINEKIDNVVFLARDGYIVKKVFEMLYSKESIHTNYMYISRKSAIAGLVSKCKSMHEILKLYKFRRKESLRDVLKRLGISTADLEENLNVIVDRKDLYNGMYDEIISKYIQIVIDNGIEQRKYLEEYCSEVFKNGKNIIVDIGWHGTIQKALMDILSDNVNIKGMYLGLEELCDSEDMSSYFEFSHLFNHNMIPYTRGVYETFFSANHSSTESYKKVNGRISPEFNGNYKKNVDIDELQDGALKFIKEYVELAHRLEISIENVSPDLVASGIINFAINPNKMDAERFGKVYFNDTIDRKLIDYKKGKIKYNIRAFLNSDWKAGYLSSRSYLKIPYGNIMAKANKLRGKKYNG